MSTFLWATERYIDLVEPVFMKTLYSMQALYAQQGLLVCWGGFNGALQKEANQGYFSGRLWDSRDLVKAIYRNYEKLLTKLRQSRLSEESGCL